MFSQKFESNTKGLQSMYSSRSFLKSVLFTFTAALALMMAAGSGVNAHDDSMPGNGQVPPHARDNMRAFHEDHHHDENLPAQAVTSCVGGTAGGYPCSNVDLMAFLPLAQIGGGNGNDIWGWTDPLNGNEYAIMGLTNGTAFVDITDPVNPVYMGNLPRPTGVSTSSWRDIKVYDNHAFIGSEAVGSGLQVMDLTQLRSVASPPVSFAQTAHYTGFSTSHNIVINESSGYAYAVGTNQGSCNRGLTFIDIVAPASPQAAGCFGNDGYTHDAQCVNYAGPDTDHQGKEICFAYNEDTLTIVDVTNKGAPVQLSRTGYANRGYSHQGWLTEDHAYVLLDDELDERNIASVTNTRTLIWNVQDLDNPSYFADYIGPATSIDHNQYVVGNYSFQANYRSGLRILDISDIANGNLTEAGFFDIYPSSDSANFNGAWSVYPFFASGNVIVSGIEQGLYILRPNLGGTPNTPPQVNIVEPVDAGPALSGTVPVHIDASDNEDPAGSLTVEWNVDGGAWQPAAWDGVKYTANWDTITVLDGSYAFTARAIDSNLSEASDTNNVSVANGEPEFTVDIVNVSIAAGNGNRNTGEARITVTDGDGEDLGGVAISGTFTGGWNGSRNGTTDGNGPLLLKTPKVKNLDFVQFCVDTATLAGWSWDISNSEICGDSNGGGSAFGSVSGRVTDVVSGIGITNAAVETDTGQATNTDAFGDYSMADVPVGNRTVSVIASGYESQDAQDTVTEGNNTIFDFALSEPPTGGGSGAIKGTVYSSEGGKIGGAMVQVTGGTSSLANKGGKYNIQNVPEGWQTVTASATGFMNQQLNVEVVAGGTVTVNFTLVPK
jgi:choice-of-anchor B domain-containing protein